MTELTEPLKFFKFTNNDGSSIFNKNHKYDLPGDLPGEWTKLENINKEVKYSGYYASLKEHLSHWIGDKLFILEYKEPPIPVEESMNDIKIVRKYTGTQARLIKCINSWNKNTKLLVLMDVFTQYLEMGASNKFHKPNVETINILKEIVELCKLYIENKFILNEFNKVFNLRDEYNKIKNEYYNFDHVINTLIFLKGENICIDISNVQRQIIMLDGVNNSHLQAMEIFMRNNSKLNDIILKYIGHEL